MNISVKGIPSTRGRMEMIEEAIALIQKNPETALAEQYLGMKNYAGFGDQRSDHQYCYGPKHGTIVFSIGRADPNSKSTLGDAEIDFLLKCRDFEPNLKDQNGNFYCYQATIKKIKEHKAILQEFEKSIEIGFADSKQG